MLFPAFAILQSIFQGWLVRRSGSIWTSCLAHGSSNALGGSLLAYLFYGGGQWILTSYAGAVALLPLAVAALSTLAAGPARRRSRAFRVAA